MLDKDKYKHFSQNNNNIPIFSKPWWLDAVSNKGQWDVILYEKNNIINGSFPFFIKKKSFFKISLLPRLTQKLGPFLTESDTLDNEKIISFLLSKLPETNYFDQNCHHIFTNDLLFKKSGFHVNKMRTSIIHNIQNIENVKKNFSKNRKYDLNKAKEYKLKINYNINADFYFEEHVKNLKNRGLKINYSKNFLTNLYNACTYHNSGKLIGVYDAEENFHASCFVVWDKNFAYLIGLTTNLKSLKSGASALLILKTIEFLSDKTLNFDFEGSMNENIFKFYNSFGGEEKKYFKIKKYKPKFLKYLIDLKN